MLKLHIYTLMYLKQIQWSGTSQFGAEPHELDRNRTRAIRNNDIHLHLRTLYILCALGCFRFLPSLDEVVFQDVQAAHHLRKDEHFVSTGLHLGEQLVNENEFTC